MPKPNYRTERRRKNSLPSSATEILDYLARHPEAQDTIDGIRQWWILGAFENPVFHEGLQHALDTLVSEGVLVARVNEKSSVLYGLSPNYSQHLKRSKMRLSN